MSAKPQLVEIEVKYDKSTQLALAKEAPDLETLLSSVKIADQETLNIANERILAGRKWLKAVDAIMDPVRDATHKAWKAAIKAQDDFKAPVEYALKRIEGIATKFIMDAQAEAQRQQRIKDEQQRKENEANAKAAAKDLKKMGASAEVIASVKEDIKARPAEAVAPIAEKAAGQSVRILYSAEIVDFPAFLKYLVTNDRLMILFSMSLPLRKAVESELRSEASAMKEKYDVPGTKLIKSASGSWRG